MTRYKMTQYKRDDLLFRYTGEYRLAQGDYLLLEQAYDSLLRQSPFDDDGQYEHTSQLQPFHVDLPLIHGVIIFKAHMTSSTAPRNGFQMSIECDHERFEVGHYHSQDSLSAFLSQAERVIDDWISRRIRDLGRLERLGLTVISMQLAEQRLHGLTLSIRHSHRGGVDFFHMEDLTPVVLCELHDGWVTLEKSVVTTSFSDQALALFIQQMSADHRIAIWDGLPEAIRRLALESDVSYLSVL